MNRDSILRIGGVPYGVGAPLVTGLETEPGVDFVKQPPTLLIDMLRQDRLDAALLSSIEAVRRPGYRITRELGIACRAEIRSVRAFRRRGVPIRTVGVDTGSATSVALLKLLMARLPDGEVADGVTFEAVAPTARPDDLPHDLVMMIGDKGLAAAAAGREIWDLGTEWVRWTQKPFVFALWLLRPGADADAILPVLRAARRRGRELGAVDGTHGAAHYDLDAEDLAGMRRYWAECRRAGFAEATDPEFV